MKSYLQKAARMGLLSSILVVTLVVMAKAQRITGTVQSDVDGRLLPGVTVQVQNSNRGPVTNVSGHYELTGVSPEDTLVFSFIGYQTYATKIGNQKVVNVSLVSAASELNQLVVVGYGEQKKGNLTGAVQQIGGENLVNRPNTNITKTLQGLLPGVNIQMNTGDPAFSSNELNVRGFNSLNGGQPLVLVDGIEGDLDLVNPSDVESITVLKDAAAAAIYGGRGSFGVILVKTKEGGMGEMKLSYSNQFGWTTPTTRRDYITDPYQQGKIVDAAIYGYNSQSYTGYDSDMDWEIIKQVADGNLEPFEVKQPDGTYKFYGKTDWYNYLYRKWQPSQIHNISIQGGSDKVTAYLSGRLLNRVTIPKIRKTQYTKYNITGKINFKVTNWLNVGGDIRLITYDQERYGYSDFFSSNDWRMLFSFMPKEIDGTPYDFHGTGRYAAVENDKKNGGDGNKLRYQNKRLVSTFRAQLTPIKDLVFDFNYTYKYNNTARSIRRVPYFFLTGNEVTMRTRGSNSLAEYRWQYFSTFLNLYGTYSKQIQNHHFKLMMGASQKYYERDRIMAEKDTLLDNSLSNLGIGTHLVQADGSALLYARRGYFGRFNYNYKGKYLLEVNARYDGSSRFPKENRWGFFPSVSAGWKISEEKFWQPIRSAVSSFKFRGSYGALGNQDVDIYSFVPTLGLGRLSWLDAGANQLIYAGTPAPLPSHVGWETTKMLDFGVDIGFLDQHLSTSFDWYKKEISGMYVPGKPLPAVFGATEPKENIASLRNIGFEWNVSYQNEFPVLGSPLHFKVTANVSNFKGVITKFENPKGLLSSFWDGQKLGTIWGYHVAGQFQSDEEAAAYQYSFDNPKTALNHTYTYILNSVHNGDWDHLRAGDPKYIDLNGDGRIDDGRSTLEDHGDIRPIGNAMPQLPFGFTINASWKGFDLLVAGYGIAQQDWYPTGGLFWGTYERPYWSLIRKDLVDNVWSPENPGGKFPQIYRGYAALSRNRSLGAINDYYLMNIGYLRIKNLTLGYTLPAALTKRVHIDNMRVYVSGEDLFTMTFGGLTKYIDPEVAGSGIGYNDPHNAAGMSSATNKYPMGKTYSFGISINL